MHPFFDIRKNLVPLLFDPKLDPHSFTQPAIASYLQFYQLEFSEDLCRKHSIGTFQSNNYDIVGQYWLPTVDHPKGTIFILHGYYDHIGLFRHVIRFVLSQGFIAVAYDQPGHGLSSGEQATINNFAEYVSVLERCLEKSKGFAKPWYGFGQSTGGAVLLHALMHEKIENPFRGVVFLAPLIRPAGWKTGIWSYRLLRRFIKKIPRHFSKNSNNEDFSRFCFKEDPLQSRYLSITWVGAMKKWLDTFPLLEKINLNALVIQGDADTTVDWRYNMDMLKAKLDGMQCLMVPGARHHLANESEDLRELIFSRIKKFILASS